MLICFVHRNLEKFRADAQIEEIRLEILLKNSFTQENHNIQEANDRGSGLKAT